MTSQQNVRQRKKSNSQNNRKLKDEKASSNATEGREAATITVELPDEGDSLSKTFFGHPLVRVAPFVLLPYIIYHVIFFVTLRHPEVISGATLGLVSFRPAMAAGDARQVLILGPEIPENRFIAGGMASTLGLEIVHEAFDSHNYFCRDGSVSWFQLMRFMEPLNETVRNKEAQFGAWKELCIDRNHTVIQLFHPKEYSPSKCSAYENWSNCWAQECFSVIKSAWGCEADEMRDCPQTFSHILHQVRHPMRTIEALNASVCPYPSLKSSFLKVVAGFFPDRDWDSLPCLDAMAWYTVDFHKTMINAREAGLIHGAFQIENNSPCEVASMAGFMDESTALYIPNAEKTTRGCRELDGNLKAQSGDLFAQVKKENKGDVIPGMTPVVLKDLADSHLAKEVNSLVSALGYAKEGDSEFL